MVNKHGPKHFFTFQQGTHSTLLFCLRLQEYASKFQKNFEGGENPPDPPLVLAPSALGRVPWAPPIENSWIRP